MLECINPTTGEVIECLKTDDRRGVHDAFRKLRRGQNSWRQTPWEKRAQILAKFGHLLGDEGHELAELLTREVGKPVRQSRTEVQAARVDVDHFSQIEPDAVFESGYGGRSHRGIVEREPLGVVTHISTWNCPYQAGIRTFVPALLAGNVVLYKPSEHAVLTGRAIGNLLHEAGIPETAFQVIVGGSSVGDFVLDERVAGVFFTGTYPTGRMVAEKLATRMIPRHMDLGGKDGVYVCEDVSAEEVARNVADGAFYNCGQNGYSVERVYVHDGVYRRFVKAICERVASYEVGDPEEESTFIGPVARKEQLSALEYQIADALQKGAELLAGGRVKGRRGYFFEPTVLVDVDHRMLVMREETSGPVIAVQSVAGDAEAARFLADTSYGLSASIFCRDEERAAALLETLDVGTVFWNGCDQVDSRIAWSGRRNSGSGASAAGDDIRIFTRPKAWHLFPPG